jgi:Ca2+-binding EF-hand superfamily protein
MRNLLLAGAAALAVIAIVPAIAQPAPPPPPGVSNGTGPAPQIHTEIHRMPMKSGTRADVIVHAREMFAKLDADHDGSVTKDEAEAAHRGMAEKLAHRGGADFPHADRGAMFDKLDANKNGSISRQEFMAAKPEIHERRMIVMRDGDGDGPVEVGGAPGEPHVKIMRMHGGMGMHMFETADANHDGRVSLQEMTNAALQHFDSADANHDGTLTPEERMQMHQRMKAKHARPA